MDEKEFAQLEFARWWSNRDVPVRLFRHGNGVGRSARDRLKHPHGDPHAGPIRDLVGQGMRVARRRSGNLLGVFEHLKPRRRRLAALLAPHTAHTSHGDALQRVLGV